MRGPFLDFLFSLRITFHLTIMKKKRNIFQDTVEFFFYIVVHIHDNECERDSVFFQDLILFADYDKSKVITHCVVEMILFHYACLDSSSLQRKWETRCYLLCYHVKRYYRVAV